MRTSSDDPIKEYCNCANPQPEARLTVDGEKAAEQCTLCLRLFRSPCPQCGAWLKDVRAHVSQAHRKKSEPRAKREASTPLEQYIASRGSK